MRDRDDDSGLSGRRFYRDKSRAWIGGVCAGVADYFGFSVGTTRLLTVVAGFAFFPVAVLLYVAVLFLVPARHTAARAPKNPEEREFRRAVRAKPKRTLKDVHRRYQQLDARLAALERHVTSPRYRLDEELGKL